MLLILAGITISQIASQDSAPNKAAEAKVENDKGAMKDTANLVTTKYIQEFYEKKYVENDPNFTYGDQGEYAEAQFATEDEGGYTYSVSSHKLTVTDANGNSVTGTINDNGTIIWDGSSSGGMAQTNIKVGNDIIDLSTLDETTVGQYYGTTVKTININDTDVEFGLFYVDYAGDYGKAGTVYLRAKSSIGRTSLNAGITDADKGKAVDIMKALNPEWARETARGNVTYSNYTSGEKGVVYLCNPNNPKWSEIGSSFNSSDLNYVIGAPSVEMFFASYNAKYPIAKPSSSRPLYSAAFKGANEVYKYPGYLFGKKVSENGTPSYYLYYTNAIQLTADATVGGMYKDTQNAEWLASPKSGDRNDYVCGVNSNNSALVGPEYYTVYGFAPIVSLKAGVNLVPASN